MKHNYYHNHSGSKALGTGLFGLALGALLGYMFSPRSGKANRERAKNWMNEMSADIQDRIDQIRDLTAERYNSIVDDVAYKYKKMQNIKSEELDDFVTDLKMRWDRIKDRWNYPEGRFE